MVGFAMEISLLGNLKARKEAYNNSKGKRKRSSSSWFEKKIRKLECTTNYNNSLLIAMWKKRRYGD